MGRSSKCLISKKNEKNDLIFFQLRIKVIDLGKKPINAKERNYRKKSRFDTMKRKALDLKAYNWINKVHRNKIL